MQSWQTPSQWNLRERAATAQANNNTTIFAPVVNNLIWKRRRKKNMGILA